MKKCARVLAAVPLLLLAASPLVATNYVVSQDGTGDFLTVQGAVGAAANGDTIEIRTGVYQENVLVTDKYLVFAGHGAGVTRLVGDGEDPTVEVVSPGLSPWKTTFRDLTVEHSVEDGSAVRWDEYGAVFESCELVGRAGGGCYYGTLRVTDCQATHVYITGGYRDSYIEDSDVSRARAYGALFEEWGATYCAGHSLHTSGSTIGRVVLGCEATLRSSNDEIGLVTGSYGCSCRAAQSEFDTIDIGYADVRLENCTVTGGIDIDMWQGYTETGSWTFTLSGCLVAGDVLLDLHTESPESSGKVFVTHSTILGSILTVLDRYYGGYYIYPFRIRGNIVSGDVRVDADWSVPVVHISHNDLLGGWFVFSATVDSVYGNLMNADPLFCDSAFDDYTLQDCSPCVGSAHDGGDMGAYGVGCDCFTAVLPTTWGRLKALYR